MTDNPRAERSFDTRVFKATVIVVATAAAAYLLWRLVDLLLLLFACALIALILVTLANLIRRKVPMPHAAALTLAVVAITAVLVGACWFFGSTMTAQFSELIARLPGAWAALQGRLTQSAMGAQLLARMHEFAPSSANVVGWLTSAISIGGGILSGLAVVIIGGLYLAAQPGLYGGGLVRLIPKRGQTESIATFDAIAAALRGWLKGQALGMVFVGVGVSIGLAIVGLPAAFAIGLVAGLAEFVPYLGTVVAVIPAVILGFSQGTDTGLWTIAVMLGVQQVQGNLVMPLLQKSMVDLPPALTIFGLIAAGILFGPVGVLLATPLTVVVLVLVRRLYLGDDTPLGSGTEAEVGEPKLAAPPRRARSPQRSTRSGSPSPP